MSKLFRNVLFVTSLEVSPFSFLVFAVVFVVGLARSEALRARRASVQGEAEGKAHDGRVLPLPEARLSAARRAACRHG